MPDTFVTPRTFRFLRELAANNDRTWFAANKERYIEDVRDPLLRFVDQVAAPLQKISRTIIADSRPIGGSLFRIHRDTRFSHDKTPYKTAAALHFRHDSEGDVHGPGFYLHIEPGRCFVGAGSWRPPSEAVKAVRDAIVARPQAWAKVLRAVDLDEGEEGDTLKRPPQGYDSEHRFIADLKRKRFTTGDQISEKDVCSAAFPKQFIAACKASAPLMEFLCRAEGLKW